MLYKAKFGDHPLPRNMCSQLPFIILVQSDSRQTNRRTEKHTDAQTDRRIDEQTDRHIRLTDRQTGAYPAVCRRECKFRQSPIFQQKSDQEKQNFRINLISDKNTTIIGRIPTKSIFLLQKSDNKRTNSKKTYFSNNPIFFQRMHSQPLHPLDTRLTNKLTGRHTDIIVRQTHTHRLTHERTN